MSTARTIASDLDLLTAYEPVVRFTEGELFFPASVEDYAARCELLERVPGTEPMVRLGPGDVTLERLSAASRAVVREERAGEDDETWWTPSE